MVWHIYAGYRQVSNISRTSVGDGMADHSDVVQWIGQRKLQDDETRLIWVLGFGALILKILRFLFSWSQMVVAEQEDLVGITWVWVQGLQAATLASAGIHLLRIITIGKELICTQMTQSLKPETTVVTPQEESGPGVTQPLKQWNGSSALSTNCPVVNTNLILLSWENLFHSLLYTQSVSYNMISTQNNFDHIWHVTFLQICCTSETALTVHFTWSRKPWKTRGRHWLLNFMSAAESNARCCAWCQQAVVESDTIWIKGAVTFLLWHN